jgi:carboxypeptidase family protein
LIVRGRSKGQGIAGVAFAFSALVLLLAFLPSAAVAATGSLSGTVTDAGAEPIEGVEVCVERGEEETYLCGFTETDGTYFIGGLQPGEYLVSFWGGNKYEYEYYDGASSRAEATLVEVLSGAETTGIDAELRMTGGIEGTVLATEDGLGVEEVEVCAYPVSGEEEGSWRCGYTAGDGSYEINGLAPGDYKVEFWPGYTGRNLAFQFWDHKSRYVEADVVSLAEAEREGGIDADLPPGASISGNVFSLSAAAPLEEVRVCSIDAITGRLVTCTWTNEAGDYGLRRLPAGQYKAVFSPELWEFFPGEAAPGEEDDGLPTQFWNNQPTLAAAHVISLGTGAAVPGIDARFGTPPHATPPTITPPAPQPKRKRKCRRGFRKKKVHGKVRCVKVRKHRRHGKRRGAVTPGDRQIQVQRLFR